MKEIIRRDSVEGRRNHASQPYRFGSRSVPRAPFSFNFAELVSPHVHTLRQHKPHPYIESSNRFSLLMYRTPGGRRPRKRLLLERSAAGGARQVCLFLPCRLIECLPLKT